jgi:hypothetical protein
VCLQQVAARTVVVVAVVLLLLLLLHSDVLHVYHGPSVALAQDPH